MTRRLALLALSAALLTGCGFHLRNALNLPENLGPVRVLASDPYSPLGELLADGLKRAGAQAAPAKAPGRARIVGDPAPAAGEAVGRWAFCVERPNAKHQTLNAPPALSRQGLLKVLSSVASKRTVPVGPTPPVRVHWPFRRCASFCSSAA